MAVGLVDVVLKPLSVLPVSDNYLKVYVPFFSLVPVFKRAIVHVN